MKSDPPGVLKARGQPPSRSFGLAAAGPPGAFVGASPCGWLACTAMLVAASGDSRRLQAVATAMCVRAARIVEWPPARCAPDRVRASMLTAADVLDVLETAAAAGEQELPDRRVGRVFAGRREKHAPIGFENPLDP